MPDATTTVSWDAVASVPLRRIWELVQDNSDIPGNPLIGMTSLTAGATHACASNGTTTYCWGNNHAGRGGDGEGNGTGSSQTLLDLSP